MEINKTRTSQRATSGLAGDLGFVMERVTRIELALSAWEVERLRLSGALTWQLYRS
jgi:hypothetical protein